VKGILLLLTPRKTNTMPSNKYYIFLLAASMLASSICVAQTPKQIKTIIVDAGHGGKDFGASGFYEGGLKSYEKNITLAISLKLIAELKKQLPNVNIIPTRTTDIYQSPREKADIANENKGDLFICIHADAANLKTGKRQISTRVETRYKITFKGKGKKKKKISTPYSTVVPVYEYYKIGCQRSGTSVWLFAARKTSDKLLALMKNEGDDASNTEDFQIENHSDSSEAELNKIDFSKPEYKMMAGVKAQRYQTKSIKLATLVNEEIESTGRASLGVNQRQVGIWVLQATNMPAILIETGFICNYNDERYLNSEKGQQELAESITRAVKAYKEQIDAPKQNSNAIQEKKVDVAPIVVTK
jgi:N-acetylmuramoyl-L-alanine amidase